MKRNRLVVVEGWRWPSINCQHKLWTNLIIKKPWRIRAVFRLSAIDLIGSTGKSGDFAESTGRGWRGSSSWPTPTGGHQAEKFPIKRVNRWAAIRRIPNYKGQQVGSKQNNSQLQGSTGGQQAEEFLITRVNRVGQKQKNSKLKGSKGVGS